MLSPYRPYAPKEPTKLDYRKSYNRVCSICGEEFNTGIKRQNICSFSCRRLANRERSLNYARSKRRNGKPLRPCQVCKFPYGQVHHEGYNQTYILCPNHHLAITTGLKTLKEVLAEK